MKMRSDILRALGAALIFCVLGAGAIPAQGVEQFENAMKIYRSGDGDAAVRAAGAPGSVASDMIIWSRLRSSFGSFEQGVEFVARRPDWPGLKLLRKKVEGMMPDAPRGDVVRAFFAGVKPQTGEGSLHLAKALWDAGLKQEAMAEAVRGWTELSLTDEAFERFRVDWPKTTKRFHWQRADMLLWRGLTGEAEKMRDLLGAGQQALLSARAGLRRDVDGVDALIEAVPASLAGDPGLAYERFLWRVRKGRSGAALELLLARSGSVESLGKPERWAGQRLRLARAAMREGNARLAYRAAASHQLTSGSKRNELEWLAGYVALVKLGDAKTALAHFRRFAAGVNTPISLGRAGYWEGRALEALGRAQEARAAFARGGQHQTAFYGLLAAEKVGMGMDPALIGAETFPNYKQNPRWNDPRFEAARLALAAGEMYFAERFLVQLSEDMDRTGVGQLAAWAEAEGAPHLQLVLAKYAIKYHGDLLVRPYFPVPDIGRGNRTVPRALELAIARRESEFDPEVVSRVGARGLMQLMPGTAQDMAKRLGIEYSAARLTDGMAYNTRLGSEYLAYLQEKYGRNPVLIAVAYNAGPGRANSWSRALGDPRLGGVDIVNWIESIPFDETRNYVMRVTESIFVYRARLTGQAQPIGMTALLKQR